MIFKRKVQILIAMVCFVFCFAITLQYKSVVRNQNINKENPERNIELETKLMNANQEIIDLSRENMQLQSDIDIYRQEAVQNNSGAAALKTEVEKYLTLMGYTNVEGPGVTIEVSDSVENPESNNAELIVHDSDIRSIVNELYGAGAEAVSVNDERLIANTPIRCVGNTIMINNKRCSTPYVIKAIGDSSALESALQLRGGILDEMKKSTIGVKLTRNDKVTIGKYNGVINYSYAVNSENQVK